MQPAKVPIYWMQISFAGNRRMRMRICHAIIATAIQLSYFVCNCLSNCEL